MSNLIYIVKGLGVIGFIICVLGGLVFVIENSGKYIPYKYFELFAATFILVVLGWFIGYLL
jgi:hypothetical protein